MYIFLTNHTGLTCTKKLTFISTMKNQLFFVLLLVNIGQIFSTNYDRTMMSQLQELCPYTSFCEENATLHFPESNNSRPCCESCSCKPGCERDNNCCSGGNDPRRICVPPTVNKKTSIINYMMIHSCLSHFDHSESSNSTMCAYDESDYKSFAPVVSKKSGEIFVNSECATCNKVHDIVPWKLAINCLPGIDGARNEITRLLNGENYVDDRCFLFYIPPKHINLESRECRNDVIRECNVSGKPIEWEPLWDYCPLFNAPFSAFNQVYGNIFCFLCNNGYTHFIEPTCLTEFTISTNMGFMILLENREFMEENSQSMESSATCGPTEKLVHSIKVECRRVECSWGKIRIGGKCGFYSKEWIGGPFVAVFKLTPLDETKKIDISILSQLQSTFKADKRATWLERNTMKTWNVEAMYRPSADSKYIDYFVTQLYFPRESANPAKLWTLTSRALKDIWTVKTTLGTIRLRVQFHRYESYKKMRKSSLREDGIHIVDEYGYVNLHYIYYENDEEYLLAVFPSDDTYIVATREVLNELFLCDLIELLPGEFSRNDGPSLVLTTTNETLYESEFRLSPSKHPFVCLSRFNQNKCSSYVHHFQIFEFIVVLWVLLESSILL